MTRRGKKRGGGGRPNTIVALHCAFCGKSADDTESLIEGPNVCICDVCIDRAEQGRAAIEGDPVASRGGQACSFCEGRAPTALAGKGEASICVECVEHCTEMLDDADPARPGAPERRAKRLEAEGEQVTEFLNVDLDVESNEDLTPLVRALEKDAPPIHHGELEKGVKRASFELAEEPADADPGIRSFVRILQKLPGDARGAWDRARSRTFSIGVQSGLETLELSIAPETLRAAAELNASISFTVYGVEVEPAD
jgi:hypothetical protein